MAETAAKRPSEDQDAPQRVEISSFVRTDHKAVDKRDALHTVKGFLTGETSKVPIVMDDGKAIGIVNERALMSRSLDLNAHVHAYALHTRALRETATIEEARARMGEFRAAYLPVEDDAGKLLGYVRAIDLARESLNGEKAREAVGSARRERSDFSAVTAADLAVNVTQLREEQTLGDALHVFQKEYVEFLPVLRRDGRVSGVLRRSDVFKMEFNQADKGRGDARGEKISMLGDAVSGFMDTSPVFVPPESSGGALLDTLEKIGYAFVGAREGRFEGVATAETLFRTKER